MNELIRQGMEQGLTLQIAHLYQQCMSAATSQGEAAIAFRNGLAVLRDRHDMLLSILNEA